MNNNDYERRRDWLLKKMKETKWDDSYEEKTKKGRKLKPIPTPKIDMDKTRNKRFFKYD